MEAQDLFWAYRNNFEKNIIYYTVNSINKLRLHAFSASTQLSFLLIFQLLVELQISTMIPDKMKKTFRKFCSADKPHELIFGTLIALYSFKLSN